MSEKPQKFYNNKNFREIFYQVLIVGIIGFFIYYILSNMFYNMSVRRIKFGFDFLWNQSGFGIVQSLIDYDESYSYGRTFFVGLLNTLLVSVLGVILATILGFVVGISRLSDNWLLRKLSAVYIEFFRNIPILLQILLWNGIIRILLPREDFQINEYLYISIEQITVAEWSAKPFFYVMMFLLLPALIGGIIFLSRWAEKRLNQTGKTTPVFRISLALIIAYVVIFILTFNGGMFDLTKPVAGRFDFDVGVAIIPEIFSLTIALGVYTATYIAEAVRSGIEAVSKGQREAAGALGLDKSATLKRIIIPQAMRVIIPPTTNQYLNLVKNSSLATAIGYPDLVSVFAGTTLNQVGQAVEIMFMTMAVYLSISLIISVFMNWYNHRVKLVER